MIFSFPRLKSSFQKICYHILLGLNISSLLLGVLYLIFYDRFCPVFIHLHGILLIIVFMGNIIMAYIEKANPFLGYGYLIFSGAFMVGLPIINTILSILPTYRKTQSPISIAMTFSLLILAGILARDCMKKRRKLVEDRSVIRITNLREIKKSLWLPLLLSGFLFAGLFLVFILIRERSNGILEAFVSEYALFYAFFFLSLGFLFLKILKKGKHIILRHTISIMSLGFFFIGMLPFLTSPFYINQAKKNFFEAFGEEIIMENKQKKFRKVAFSIPDYFYGIPSGEYELIENVLFYQGQEGVDQGLKLSFDLYQPVGKETTSDFPVLIRIHGGGWTIGDKGAFNFAQMNKYFAQNYVVFDIQYGLNDKDKFMEHIPVEETRRGAYTIDDMVRHVGIFTKHLAKHAKEYKADLNHVFISGGSAGGQLALAAGLSIHNGSYHELLAPEITIKGLIPFYPANGLSEYMGIGGLAEFVDPIHLVDQNSPPCIIYQGTHDTIVDPLIAKRFYNAYRKQGNQACALLTMPYAGHGTDLYFSGYYNQVFLYYMERFMEIYD